MGSASFKLCKPADGAQHVGTSEWSEPMSVKDIIDPNIECSVPQVNRHWSQPSGHNGDADIPEYSEACDSNAFAKAIDENTPPAEPFNNALSTEVPRIQSLHTFYREVQLPKKRKTADEILAEQGMSWPKRGMDSDEKKGLRFRQR